MTTSRMHRHPFEGRHLVLIKCELNSVVQSLNYHSKNQYSYGSYNNWPFKMIISDLIHVVYVQTLNCQYLLYCLLVYKRYLILLYPISLYYEYCLYYELICGIMTELYLLLNIYPSFFFIKINLVNLFLTSSKHILILFRSSSLLFW